MTARPPRSPRPARWSRAPRLLEVVTLVVIGLAVAVDVFTRARAGVAPLGYLGPAIAVAGVALIRRGPVAALVLVAAGPVTDALLGGHTTALWSIGCFAAFLLALRGLPGSLTGVVIGVANVAAAGLDVGTVDVTMNATASVAGFAAVACAATGSSIRGHRRYWLELERRTADAEANRQAAVDRSIAEERVRIARDLHDSVGHHIAVVSMHLGSAEVRLPADADAARNDLRAARTAVQAVLGETQQILRVLRVEGGDSGPTPEHGRIPELIDAFRGAGLAIEATITAIDRPLAPDVSAAAYRIVQEALTNAQRHGAGHVAITVTIAGEVRIDVINARGGPAAPGGGRGLVGMRERASSVGGTLDVRADESLYRVGATLPTRTPR